MRDAAFRLSLKNHTVTRKADAAGAVVAGSGTPCPLRDLEKEGELIGKGGQD